jgi:hypothetical protein
MAYLTKSNPNFEATFLMPNENTGESVWVFVSKIGGGTLGREYDGCWDVKVVDFDQKELFSDEIYTSLPRSHRKMAHLAVESYL